MDKNASARTVSPEDAVARGDAAPRWEPGPWAEPVLFAAAAVLFCVLSRGALSASELRYAESGREMASSGDWIVPRLAYVPYFEKPILLYWCEAASQLLFGASELATRIPSILSALTMVAATYALGRDVRGRTFGLGAAALLLASPVFDVMSTRMMTDPLFAALLVVAWLAFRRHDLAPASRWKWVFWAALGLAVLTKGPLGIGLVGTTVAAYLLLARRPRDAFLLRPFAGAAIVVAINAPWTIAVWMRDPRFLHFFYVRQNLRAFVNGRINHSEPVWYYTLVLLAAGFPFVVYFAWGLWKGLRATAGDVVRWARQRGGGDALPAAASGALYVQCMLWPPLLLLTVAQSKLATYVLPLLPAVAIVVATSIADHAARPTRLLRWAPLAQTAILAAAGVWVALATPRDSGAWDAARALLPSVVFVVGSLLLPMAAGSVLALRRRIIPAMVVTAAGTLAAVVVASEAAEDLLADADARAFVPTLRTLRGADEPIVIDGKLAQDYALQFGLGERIHIWGNAREVGMGHFTDVTPHDVPVPDEPYDVNGGNLPANPWLLSDARFADLWRGEGRVWYVGRQRDVKRIADAGLTTYEVASNAERLLLTNRPPER